MKKKQVFGNGCGFWVQFEVSEKVRLSIMDKIENYYAPKLKAYYTAL